jgi:hypothetical protein
MITETESEVTLLEIAINDLARRSLNNGFGPGASANLTESVDMLEETLRRVGLGITVALLEVANAVRETK